MSTTETRTREISSRSAREETRGHWRCPAPDGHGGKCFRALPCHAHHIWSPHIGMLAYGSSFLVPDSVEQPVTPEPIPEGWRSIGFVPEDGPYIDERLSRMLGITTVVDPAMPRDPGWKIVGLWNHGSWCTPEPPAYPHPETGRLASIAPWLTIHPDGKVTYA